MDQATVGKKCEERELSLAESLQRMVETLVERSDVEHVILFGSCREGRRDLFTDLDIAVVVSSNLDFVSRTAQMCRCLTLLVGVDLLVYTPEELERIGDRPFVRRILERGEIIYERQRC